MERVFAFQLNLINKAGYSSEKVYNFGIKLAATNLYRDDLMNLMKRLAISQQLSICYK